FFEPQFVMHGTPIEKVGETLGALFNFGFIPHDWGFHRDRPVVGALFTLLLPLLLIVRPRPPRRLVLTVVGIEMAVAVWYVIKHQDRYLQVLMPWMAAVTAALLVLGWRQGRVARATLVALVGLQIVWGADVYFIRSHAMIGDSVLKATVDFVSAGHDGHYRERFRHPGSLEDVAPQVPAGAVVMQHEVQEKLGLGAPAICDMPEWQGALEYLIQDVPADVEALWRKLGATHVLWMPRKGGPWEIDKLAREAVFHRTVEPYVDMAPIDVGQYRLIALPPPGTAPVDSSPTRIAWMSCAGDPPNGVYTAADLAERRPLAPLVPAAVQAGPDGLAAANAAVLRSGCGEWAGTESALIRAGFRHRFQSGDHQLWVR